MPATAERVYVTCDSCDNRIADPNVDHDKNCGAPLAYRNKLAKELQAKKIKAAAGSEPILTEGGAVLLTEDGHPLMTEAPKATRKRRGEVDGREANIHHDPPAREEEPPARDYSALWRDPHVDVAWVFALQAKIDAAEIEIGGISAGKACIGKMTADDDGSPVEVDCTHATVLRHIRKNTCNLDHQHSETLAQVCLIHAITSWGGGIAPAGNGPLFAGGDDE